MNCYLTATITCLLLLLHWGSRAGLPLLNQQLLYMPRGDRISGPGRQADKRKGECAGVAVGVDIKQDKVSLVSASLGAGSNISFPFIPPSSSTYYSLNDRNAESCWACGAASLFILKRTHPNPDADATGCNAALLRCAQELKFTVETLSLFLAFSSRLQFLRGAFA